MGYRCQEDKRSVFFETERVQNPPTEKGQHTEEERKNETARDSDHERQGHAGPLPDGSGTRLRRQRRTPTLMDLESSGVRPTLLMPYTDG